MSHDPPPPTRPPASPPSELPKNAGVWENLGTSEQLAPASAGRASSALDVAARRRRLLIAALGAILLGLSALGVAGWVDLSSPLVALAILGMTAAMTAVALAGDDAARRSLAFFGRFIRPGLQRLLEEEGAGMLRGDKLFRGRKTVIMKIDMVDYTKTTFPMPYGIRRLFQDLWFTLIDRVVADQVFLDKSLGDGSIYCFEDDLPGGSCSSALRAALEIRDRQVRRFDEEFTRRLRAKLEAEPELSEPAARYFAEYRERVGGSVWQRTTSIRIALVVGYVDEGLWGLSSQSHYDVQGTPMILATRLEDGARNGEIVFDRAFYEELRAESPALLDASAIEQRTMTLKGIGAWDVLAIPPGRAASASG
ncbi:MAG: hypothetical protein AAGC60_20325 [Acidobacteriota bacterium]